MPSEPAPITAALQAWIDDGLDSMGEVAILRESGGGAGYFLCHKDDRARARETPGELRAGTRPEDAREIARFDDRDEYRPLKTAPTLRSGWILRLPDIMALREALDYFYPAMAGTWFQHQHGRLQPVNLRETLDRQTGMYRFARNITDDSAREIVGRMCRSDTGCLKKILWKIGPDTEFEGLPASKFDPEAAPDGVSDHRIPMVCAEACTFIVSEARRASQEAFKQTPQTE